MDSAGLCSVTAGRFRIVGLEDTGGSLSLSKDLRSLWRGDVEAACTSMPAPLMAECS